MKWQGGVAFYDEFLVLSPGNTKVSGIAGSAFTPTLTRNGAHYTAVTPTVSEIDSANQAGRYRMTFTPVSVTGTTIHEYTYVVDHATYGQCLEDRLYVYSVDYPGFQSSQGTGATTVDHNTPTADNLAAKTGAGAGIANVTVRAYLTSDYTAGNHGDDFLKGQALTDTNGQWVSPMYLASGAYTFTYTAAGYTTNTKTYTVP